MPECKQTISEVGFKPQGDVFQSPEDWRDVFLYFLLVDRFDNNKDGIPPYDPATTQRGRDNDEGSRFQRGNLKGITRRLDYIQGLGANAVWLSPVFRNREEKDDSYHGYGIQNFLEVDPRFGSKEDLRELVRQAHQRGMYIVLDIIINHTGDNWAYPEGERYYYWKDAHEPFKFGYWREADPAPGLQCEDAVWPGELQHEQCYKRRGEIRNWYDREEAVNGDFLSLKELDINRPEVLDTLIKAYKYWIAYADVDGFRIDTVKHMENTATAIFCNAIREYAKSIGKRRFFIYGEIVDDDWTIQSYIGRNTHMPGSNERLPSLDAALDFPLYFILEERIKGLEGPTKLRERYDAFRDLYSDHGEAGRYFVTFVDNHDQMSRKYRRFMNNNPFPQQAVLAMGYLLTSQGVPCIYYGTEQGFDGGGDNDKYVRECMFGGQWGAFDTTGHHFFDTLNPIYKKVSAIAAIRHGEAALRYGRQYFREISGDGNGFGFPYDGKCTLAYSRILDTTEVLVAMNLDMDERQDYIIVDRTLNPEGSVMVNLLEPESAYNVAKRGQVHAVRVSLEPHQMAILKRKEP